MRLVAKTKGELGGEGAVEFEGDEMAAAGGEDLGNRTVAGADFDDGAFAKIAKGLDDSVARSIIYKKVLAEFWFAFHLYPMPGLRTLID